MGDSRLWRIVQLLEKLKTIEAPDTSQDFYQSVLESGNDAFELLPTSMLMEASSFSGVERRLYAEICTKLTERMVLFAGSSRESIEGGLVEPDSRWPLEVRIPAEIGDGCV